MHSSTSSFKRFVPPQSLIQLLLAGLVAGLLLIVLLENLMRLNGVQANVRETATLWSTQRELASGDDNSLILIGSSRMQLGVDLEQLQAVSGQNVVQLAIDGSPYFQVLQHLADDPTVTGEIWISTGLDNLLPIPGVHRAGQWLDEYETSYRGSGFIQIENRLVSGLQSLSALYANVTPVSEILRSMLAGEELPVSYVSNQANRERNADYNLAVYPDVYVTRVMRTLDQPLPTESFADVDAFDAAVVQAARSNSADFSAELNDLSFIRAQLSKLQQRGVTVVFIQFPLSGAVAAINDIRYPKPLWDRIMSELGATSVDYRDYPPLQYELVDGSHLDVRQKTEFTRELYRIVSQQD